LSEEDLKCILKILLEIIFETSIKALNSTRLLIRKHNFLRIYLQILALLSKDMTNIGPYCKFLFESIKGSYWNYHICGKVFTLHKS